MSSSQEFVQYVADQISEAGLITFRKMFGEYGMYCDGKISATTSSLLKSHRKENSWRPAWKNPCHMKARNHIFL